LASKSILERGFKTKAEKIAIECKEKLNLHPCAPICAFKLAEHLKVKIFNPTEFSLSEEEIIKLTGEDSGWSALTMETKQGNRIIIHNNNHTLARQQSNIMHEIAHILCNHQIEDKYTDMNLPFGMRDFNKLQEEEAICLGSTIQLSKPSLQWALKRNMSPAQIAVHFDASIEMVNFRLRMTGLHRLIKY